MGFKVTSHRLEVETALSGAIERALETCGLAAEGYAKRLCPVDTGRLRNSITYATETNHSSGSAPAKPEDYSVNSSPNKNTVYIGTNVEYAPYVEMGTTRTRAQPFLKPALVNNAQVYRRILEQTLKDT